VLKEKKDGKVVKERNHQFIILCLAKLSLRSEGEILSQTKIKGISCQ
jgi:hypothetical protein